MGSNWNWCVLSGHFTLQPIKHPHKPTNFLQELLTLTDKYTFEISTKEEVVRKLDVQYKR
jgi:hypothetical protein